MKTLFNILIGKHKPKSSILDSIRARVTLTLMAKGGEIKESVVEDIPEKWSKFPNTNDSWVSIPFPDTEDVTACLYDGKKGTTFFPHKHPNNVEHFLILNKKGKVKVITDTYMREVCYPNAVLIKRDEPHTVRFLEDTMLLVIWHPKMVKGWGADYLK